MRVCFENLRNSLKFGDSRTHIAVRFQRSSVWGNCRPSEHCVCLCMSTHMSAIMATWSLFQLPLWYASTLDSRYRHISDTTESLLCVSSSFRLFTFPPLLCLCVSFLSFAPPSFLSPRFFFFTDKKLQFHTSNTIKSFLMATAIHIELSLM